MNFKISFINPKTGEQESKIIKEADCWATINSIFSKMIPDGRIKPVNFKLELLLETEE